MIIDSALFLKINLYQCKGKKHIAYAWAANPAVKLSPNLLRLNT